MLFNIPLHFPRGSKNKRCSLLPKK
ncbi:MAG: hypothetical protein K2Q18_00465 [Bdellovibrionales bacterium]|nr:hypothetical protein [Bdellovibrionales bacterium]